MTQYPDLFGALAAPFTKDEVRFRDGGGGNKFQYVTSRAVMNRLDEVLGPENWWDDFVPLEHSVICRLTIRLPDGVTLTKSDAGGYAGMKDQGDDDKSGFADAFKRAAVKFGPGRYLYRDGIPNFAGNGQAPTGRSAPSPAPTKAPEQKAPLDFLRPPRAGSGAVYYWVKDVGAHFGVDLVGRVREVAKIEQMSDTWGAWDQEEVDRMLGRAILYCQRLPQYKGEFDALARPSPNTDKEQARNACIARAALLFQATIKDRPYSDAEMNDILLAFSHSRITNIHACEDLEVLKATAAEIKKYTEEINRPGQASVPVAPSS